LVFQTLAPKFGAMKGFFFLYVQISLSSMSKFGNLRGFFSLCSKRNVGFEIRCQDLDFQSFSVFDPPNFGAKHWKDEKNQLFFFCFFSFA
jgi:hypothetical protein